MSAAKRRSWLATAALVGMLAAGAVLVGCAVVQWFTFVTLAATWTGQEHRESGQAVERAVVATSSSVAPMTSASDPKHIERSDEAAPRAEPKNTTLPASQALAADAADTSVACELPLRLAAVVQDPRRPRRSIAFLRGSRPGSSHMARIGARYGDFRLVEVQPLAARFELGDDSCWLRMFSQNALDKIEVERSNDRAAIAATKRGRHRRARPAADYPPTRALSPNEIARGIHAAQPGSYILDPEVVAKIVERWDHVAATTAIAAPRKGRRGLRFVSLRRAGVLAALGFREGDVLRAVNGRPVRRKRDLQQTVVALGSSAPTVVELDRGGRALQLNYVAR
jgi:hypothetical protein